MGLYPGVETKQLAKILIYVLKKLNANMNNAVTGEALKGN